MIVDLSIRDRDSSRCVSPGCAGSESPGRPKLLSPTLCRTSFTESKGILPQKLNRIVQDLDNCMEYRERVATMRSRPACRLPAAVCPQSEAGAALDAPTIPLAGLACPGRFDPDPRRDRRGAGEQGSLDRIPPAGNRRALRAPSSPPRALVSGGEHRTADCGGAEDCRVRGHHRRRWAGGRRRDEERSRADGAASGPSWTRCPSPRRPACPTRAPSPTWTTRRTRPG